MRLEEAPTPALVLDRGRLKANCERMLARVRERGLRLRPHLKTLKSADAARVAVDPKHGGLAVSTLAEAEYFADHGFTDIQYAVPITPQKLSRAAAVLARAERFSVFVDDPETARAVADFARGSGAPLRVWIEVDTGLGRTGADPLGETVIDIARALDGSPVVLEGVAAHAGHSYAARGGDALAAVAEAERTLAVSAAERLRAAGYAAPGVSVGSTPTAVFGRASNGLTEIRAGVYTAGDLFQAGLGVMSEGDVAVTVLASVISRAPDQGRLVVDAGGLALSKDRATAGLGGADSGYGRVLDVAGRPAFGRLNVADVHQEHGIVRDAAPEVFARLPLGAKVRVAPNHVCMTAAAHDRYLVVDGGTEVVEVWDRANGW